jgi:energy-coupling factor transporter ATP-binding protein EcfA2
LPEQAHRFVTVIGPSGAGKSSLVQAGLIPRLAQQRSRWVVIPSLVPGGQPTKSLACSLAAVLPGAEVDTLSAELASDPTALVRCVEQLRVASGGRSVLLVVDQAEELLTRTGAQERTEFLGLLDRVLRDDPRLWVVATLRSEFLTGFLTTGFSDLFQHPVMIGALNRAALFQVIEGPAAQVGVTFAPADSERRVVDAFVTARLLTSNAMGDGAVIEVAHEALFRQWPPLRQAIEARAMAIWRSSCP